MGSLNRRTLMVGGAAVMTAICAGCLSDADETRDPKTTSGTPQEREYDAENPFSILLMNDDATTRTVAIKIARNGDSIYDDTIDVEPGDQTTVAEYETTGRYTILAETDDQRMETAAEIERENLQTSRAAFGRITVDDGGVLVEVVFDD